MAKGSSVLSNIFGFFNLLFAIVGAVVIVLAILVHVHLSNVQEFEKIGGVVILYVIGFITLTISFLGAYGAFRQVKWMLIVFLVLMCVGFLFLARIAVTLAIVRPQVDSIAEEQLDAVLPLDKTSMDFQSIMDAFQSSMHCCGLSNGYKDWNENVPESCNCPPPEETMTDVCVVIPGNYLEALFSQRMVYSQSCGPILLTLLKTAFDGVMGVFFGLTALTVLGIAISSCLIARINKNRIAGVVLGPTLVFSTSPPKYNELVNEPYH